jgi:hypothetical protein
MAEQPIIAALSQQVACYRRLADLARLQHKHVQQHQTEALLDVLLQRTEVLSRVGELEAAVAPVRPRWRGFVDGLADEDRRLVEAAVAEIRALLEQITAADRDDALVLQQRKINLGRQVSQAAAARQINRTYAAAAYGQMAARMDVQR